MPKHFWTASCHRHSTLASQTQVSTSPKLYPDIQVSSQACSFLICIHMTYRSPYCARGHHSFQSYLRKQRIFLGVAIVLAMYLCTHAQLDCNQFSIILDLVYACQDWRSFGCGEDFGEKHRPAITLISSHESIEQQSH